MMNPMIKGVAFDAYGTLFDVYSIGVLADVCFPGQGAALATLWRDKQVEYTRLRTLCDRYADFWVVTGDALDFCCEQMGLPLTAAMRTRLLDQYAHLAPHPENPAALRAMAATGIPLSILSNGTRAMLETAVAAAGLQGLFAHILSADTVRKYKTAPEVYQLAPEALGCPPRETLFVSSNCWDVCGAAWFGYTTFWVNRAGRPLERLGVTPTATGRDLQAVAAFLDVRADGSETRPR
jgi:2-haloacid dehalogenase